MNIKFIFHKLYDNHTDFSLLQALNDVQTFISTLFSNSKYTGIIFQIVLENNGSFTSFTKMLRVNKNDLHLINKKLTIMYNFNIVKYQSIKFTNVFVKYYLIDSVNVKTNIKFINLISRDPTVINDFEGNPPWTHNAMIHRVGLLPEQVKKVFVKNATTVKLVDNGNSPIPKILPGLWQIVNYILRVIFYLFFVYFSLPPPPRY